MKRSFIRTLPLGMMCTLMCNNLTAQEVDFDLSSQRSEIQNVSRVFGEKRTGIDWVINPVPHKIALNSSKLLDVSNGVEENAFNGGFFIKNNEISAESLSVNKLNSILKSTTVEIVDGVIKNRYVRTFLIRVVVMASPLHTVFSASLRLRVAG